MKTLYSSSKKLWLILSFLSFFYSQNLLGTHAQSADITYQCINGNQFQVSVSFYRDCSGANAPNSISINTSSATCNQNFNTTLNQIPGTGIDVTPICNTLTTVCNGGNYPGVQEYIYRGIINIPMNCVDWTFSFSLCCRNNAINTINNPGNENIYVEAKLNNFDVLCNNSPTFSNPPVSFPCVGQTSCFNHGAFDPDGDSLYYTLLAPATGPNTTVTYVPGYSALQPLMSNPAITFNPMTGDICMTPTLQEVTVLAVRVEEWRNGIFIGSVIRDIQLRTIVCNNNLPYTTGINGQGNFSATVCANSTINFTIPSFDIDNNQNITLTWNNSIPNANFTTTAGPLPTGTFNWTPTANNISQNPYCFTVTVSDDNCPINGVQIYSFCITVAGFTTSATSTPANCNASNGTAYVTVTGGTGPFTYLWSPNGGNNQSASGLSVGQYTVLVTDANGCTSTSTVNVGQGAQPGNINITSINVSCFNGNNGSATANVNGGQPPYTYAWSNGGTTPTINNLIAGTYWVIVTTNSNCTKVDTVVITEPTSPVTATTTKINATCFGGNNGSATVNPSGGTPPYTVSWNTTPIQNGLTANNLTTGTYIATITDNNGCTTTQSVTITSPQPLNVNLNNMQNVSCFNGSNGSIMVTVSGGTSPYTYNWNNNTFPNAALINNLPAGSYNLIVTDANGCTINAQYDIIEPTQLIASITNFNHITCNGMNNGSIQTNTTGGSPPYTYLWSPTALTTPNINNLGQGYYVLAVTDSKGCWDTATVNINEPSVVATVAQGNDTICPGQSTNISAAGFGGVGNYTYLWSNNFVGNNQNVSPTATTKYLVTATDANGCVGTPDSVLVTVNDINMITLNTVPDTTICEGGQYLISANVTGGIGNYVYNWNNSLGQGQGPFAVSPLSNTNYIVTVTDVCGNSINKSVLVNVNPLPSILLQSQNKTACGAVKINLTNNSVNPTGTTYFWNFGDNTSSTQETPEKIYTQTGIYNVTLTVTSSQGCTNTGQTIVNITVNPKPVAQFDYSPSELTMLDPEVHFDNYSSDANFYAWTFGDGATSNVLNPIHKYATDGSYLVTLIASNTYGCKDTASKELLIEPEYSFYIPNAFTPNNDGDNDIFTAIGEEIENFNMQIFNRWGEIVYETSDLDNGWDGTTKGGNELAMAGTYVYSIQLKDWQGLHHKFTGKVTLLK